MDLPDQVRRTALRHEMFSPGQTVVVGVSGGPDSVALLHSLHAVRAAWPISLVAAHLDHGFRGEQSAADAEYVRELCHRLEIPCHTAYENVPEQKKRLHLSSQVAARRARHAYLLRVAEEAGAERIALGHTRDDRVETILLNLLRGTGPEGLRGFPPCRFPLVRPLYDCSRADTVAYCAASGLEPRADPSNATLDYRRNRIRNETLPYLSAHFNPRIGDALLRLSDIASAESELLDQLAMRELRESETVCAADEVCLEVAKLNERPMALRRRMLRLAVLRLRNDLVDIEHAAIDRILASVEQRSSFAVDVAYFDGRTFEARGDGEILRLSYRKARLEPIPWYVPIPIPGRVELPGRTLLEARLFDCVAGARAEVASLKSEGAIERDADVLLLPFSAISMPIAARSWRPGDRMRPRGMKGSKKLQDILVDRKVPADRRANIPVIVEAAPDGSAGRFNDVRLALTSGRILGILGAQGGEASVKAVFREGEPEIIGAFLLILALSHTTSA